MAVQLLTRAAEFGERFRQPSDSFNREHSIRQVVSKVRTRYDFWEAVYENRVYTRPDSTDPTIRTWPGFPKSIRPISLAAKRAVDWWPGSVYPGTWTRDGLSSSNGRPNRIPYDEDTPPELRDAVQQAYTWGNGPRFLSRLVHLGASLGDVFAEVEVHYNDVDPSSNKVYPVLVHPSHVVELELNARGDVKSYRLAIPQYDERLRREYIWGKKVDRDSITTYYDDGEHSYVEGQPATIPNPWGFVAAVWIPHRYAGGLHGSPVMDVVITTLAEYQGVLSSIDDFLHKFVRQGVIIETPDPEGLQKFLRGQLKAVESRNESDTIFSAKETVLSRDRDRQQINAFPVPVGTRVHHLIQNLGLDEAESHVARLAREIEDALPEIVFTERLQDMDQVTRPGATALISRVQGKLDDATSNYDLGAVKLGQMCAAIGGELIHTGEWGSSRTAAQNKFALFDLESYAKGELDFGLVPRELIPRSKKELAEEAQIIESLRTPNGLRHVGYSDVEIYGEGQDVPEERPGILGLSSPAIQDQLGSTIGDQLATAFRQGVFAP